MAGREIARQEREGVCDVLSSAGPDALTLCEGWKTRDLAAHLFVRERRPLAMPGIMIGGSCATFTRHSMLAALRAHGYQGVVDIVRSGPPLLWRPIDPLVNLVEFFVHHEDVRRAQPDWEPRSDAFLDAALWASLARIKRLLRSKVHGVGLELVSPQGARIVVRDAEPTVAISGEVQELALFVYGRGEVANVTLSGTQEAQRIVRAASFGV